MPDDVDWGWVCGAGTFCGVGFTMSLHVAALSFTDTAGLDAAWSAARPVLAEHDMP